MTLLSQSVRAGSAVDAFCYSYCFPDHPPSLRSLIRGLALNKERLLAPRRNRVGPRTLSPRRLANTWIAGAILLSALFADSASAQEAGVDPFAGIEEMIVVGTTSASLLQSEEVSVVGFDSDYLEALGASDLSDISQFTPNLEIRTPFAASNPTLFIRGVGLRDFNANSSSSVAVYNDDIYMNSPAGQLAQLFDVANVDVLRGPQGGIYGRNASAGAIRVISRKPTGTPGGYVSATYGRFQQIDLEGAAEAALVPEILSMRISGKLSRRGGHTKNRCGDPNFNSPFPGELGLTSFRQRVHLQCFNPSATASTMYGGLGWTPGTTPPVKERVNDVSNWAIRALFRAELDLLDGLDILVNFHGGQNRGDARQFQLIGARQAAGAREPRIDNSIANRDFPSGYADPDNEFHDPEIGGGPLNGIIRDPFGGKPFEGDYNNVEKEKLDLFGTSISTTLTAGDWTHKLILGYEWNQRDVTLNLDGNPFPSLEPILENTSWQVTGEGRVGWDAADGLSLQLAGMFLYESLDVDNEFQINFLDTRLQSYEMWTRYYSVYGELDWEPSEFLTVHVGGRFNHENKEMKLAGRGISRLAQLINPNGDFTNFIQNEKSEAKEPGVAWDITFSYLPTDDVTFYTKYARGWKGPHINGLVLSNATVSSGESLTTPVDPEQIDSVEFGAKTLWWDARVKANFAAFYYDYNDLQVFRLRNTSGGLPVNQLINAKDADVLGIEFDIDLRPFEGIGPPILDGFNLFASFAWLDSAYTDFVNTIKSSPGGVPPITVSTTIDYSGAQLVNSPEFSFVGYTQWILPTAHGTFVPRFDWSFKDDIFFSPENSELVGQKALWLMNLRLTYKAPSENIEISGWVENLTDQTYTLDVFNLARFRGSILYAIGDPRTYGMSVKVTF